MHMHTAASESSMIEVLCC